MVRKDTQKTNFYMQIEAKNNKVYWRGLTNICKMILQDGLISYHPYNRTPHLTPRVKNLKKLPSSTQTSTST